MTEMNPRFDVFHDPDAESLASALARFEALPDEITDRHELVDGDLIPVPSATLKNSLIRDKLLFLLSTWSSSHHLATAVSEMDVRTGSRSSARSRLAGSPWSPYPCPSLR